MKQPNNPTLLDFIISGRYLSLKNVEYVDSKSSKKPFKDHYNQHILPLVEQFESNRKLALDDFRSRVIKSIPISTLVIILAFIFFSIVDTSSDIMDLISNFVLFAFLTYFIGITIWCYTPVSNYKNSVKKDIFPKIFSFFGDYFIYKPKPPIFTSSLHESLIIPSYDEETSEDYVKGIYNNVNLELYESKLTRTTGSGRNRRTEMLFRGIFILLSMNKNFKGKTIVKQDRGVIANFLDINIKNGGLSKVKLEDPVFEKSFDVFSTDQVEARYLLTTTFMERFLKLKEYSQATAIECSFFDNKLLLKISTNIDRFETRSIMEPATFIPEIQTIINEMNGIFDIIDILKLDQKIGL